MCECEDEGLLFFCVFNTLCITIYGIIYQSNTHTRVSSVVL